jgi:hypothetical protein
MRLRSSSADVAGLAEAGPGSPTPATTKLAAGRPPFAFANSAGFALNNKTIAWGAYARRSFDVL